MKKLLLAAMMTSSLACAQDLDFEEVEDITYELLLHMGADYMPSMKMIFDHLRVKNFLEFGMGYSTEYFLNKSNKVISVEFVTQGCGPESIKDFIGFYSDYSNWTPIFYFTGYQGDVNWAPYKYLGSESVYKAVSYQTSTHKNYALVDDFYTIELNAFISRIVRFHSIDVALVNSSCYLRGDMVQLLFGKVPVIVATHTSCRSNGLKDDVYGYSRIVTPEDYEEIVISGGGGTTIWVLKKEALKELASTLKENADSLH